MIRITGRAHRQAGASDALFAAALLLGSLLGGCSDPVSPPVGDGSSCFDYGRAMRWESNLPGFGSAYAVAVSGEWVLLGGHIDLQVVDVTGPVPEVVGSVTTGRLVSAIVATGSHAYVPGSGGDILVVDLTSPETPSIVRSVETGDASTEVPLAATRSSVLARAGGANGGFPLLVIDSRVPSEARVTARLPVFPEDVAASGDIALVSGGYDGQGALVAIDVTDPHAPVILDVLPLAHRAGDVCVVGQLALVLDGPVADPGLVIRVIDIQNPSRLREIGSLRLAEYLFRPQIVASGSDAYLASYRELFRIDLRTPPEPRIVDVRQLPTDFNDVAIGEGTVYVASPYRGLDLFDVRGEARTPAVSSARVDSPLSLAVSGDLACVWARGAIRVFDLSFPARGREVGSVAVARNIGHLDLENYLAYAVTTTGLTMVDVSDPAAPGVLGEYSFITGWDVVVQEPYAYVVGSGLRVVDIRNPQDLEVVGTSPGSQSVARAAVAGDYVYMVERSLGLTVFDVSSPDQPVGVSFSSVPDAANDVDVDGLYAYVAGGSAGLLVFDVSDPANPVLVASAPTQADAREVAVADGLAYVADVCGVKVFDVSVPSAPRRTGGGHVPWRTGRIGGSLGVTFAVDVGNDRVAALHQDTGLHLIALQCGGR